MAASLVLALGVLAVAAALIMRAPAPVLADPVTPAPVPRAAIVPAVPLAKPLPEPVPEPTLVIKRVLDLPAIAFGVWK